MDTAALNYIQVFLTPDIRKIDEDKAQLIIKQINENTFPKELKFKSLVLFLSEYTDIILKIQDQTKFWREYLLTFYDNNENDIAHKDYFSMFDFKYKQKTTLNQIKPKLEYLLKFTMIEFHTRLLNFKKASELVDSILHEKKEELFNDILKKYGKDETEMRVTMSQFRKHNLKDSNLLYVLISGNVYELSKFEHPPGIEVYSKFRLSDKGEKYKSIYSHGKSTDEKMKEFYVGKLTGREFVLKEEFEKNDGTNGRRLWILINNIVYDVTDFNHPPGKEVFMKDRLNDKANNYYFQEKHSITTDNLMETFYVGELKK